MTKREWKANLRSTFMKTCPKECSQITSSFRIQQFSVLKKVKSWRRRKVVILWTGWRTWARNRLLTCRCKLTLAKPLNRTRFMPAKTQSQQTSSAIFHLIRKLFLAFEQLLQMLRTRCFTNSRLRRAVKSMMNSRLRYLIASKD